MRVNCNHISVCICTYRRPAFLSRLLTALTAQITDGQFTYSIVVCDNDRLRSAEALVSDFVRGSSIGVTYCVEPRQNIALARNESVRHATGNYIAFIDDDEFPEDSWLQMLFDACDKYGADGILGPVKPSFPAGVPRWVVKGRFYNKPSHETGFVLGSQNTRTSNALVRKSAFQESTSPFRPEFRTGEDRDFFRRAIDRGCVFIWCNEAVVYEEVPPSRWKRRYLLRKAMLRGACAALPSSRSAMHVGKAIVAVVVYGLGLPFAALLGQHRFMSLLVRLFDHLGMLLAIVGMNPVTEPYVLG